jgi:hypothetical protein
MIDQHAQFTPIQELKNKNYIFIKFIMNTYRRAVSSFHMFNLFNEFEDTISDRQKKANLSFREYLKVKLNSPEIFEYELR